MHSNSGLRTDSTLIDDKNRTLRSLCSSHFVALPATLTVAETIAELRRSGPPSDIFYLYVTDPRARLIGVVPIRSLIIAQDQTTLAEVMSKRIIFLNEALLIKDASRVFSDSRFLSLPVVDEQGHILGVVHAHQLLGEGDRAIESLFEARSRGQLFELLGIQAEEGRRSSLSTAAGRFPWLIINIIGGILSAIFIQFMGSSLTDAVAYLAFVPILLVISESIGMQSASLTLALLHRTGASPPLSPLLKQLKVSSILGLFAAGLMAVIVYFWRHSLMLAVVLGSSLLIGATLVSIIGTMIPLAIHRLKFDPQVAAGPVVLALADCCTLLIFLGIALALAH